MKWLLFALQTIVFISAAPAQGKGERILVLDVVGAEKSVSKGITGLVVSELTAIDGLEVLGTGEIAAVLDLAAAREISGCANQDCVADAAVAIDARWVLLQELSTVGSLVVLSLSLFDEEQRTFTARESLQGKSVDDLVLGIGPLVDRLAKQGFAKTRAKAVLIETDPLTGVSGERFWLAVAVGGGSALAGLGIGVGLFLITDPGYGFLFPFIGPMVATFVGAAFFDGIGGTFVATVVGTAGLLLIAGGAFAGDFIDPQRGGQVGSIVGLTAGTIAWVALTGFTTAWLAVPPEDAFFALE